MNDTNLVEIIDGIFIGGYKSESDAQTLQNHNIRCIVNCTTDIPIYFGNVIESMRIPVNDNKDPKEVEKLKKYISHAVNFIEKNHQLENKNVLVHCHAGVQRSATVIAAYLMKSFDSTFDQAKDHILSKHSLAFRFGQQANFRHVFP